VSVVFSLRHASLLGEQHRPWIRIHGINGPQSKSRPPAPQVLVRDDGHLVAGPHRARVWRRRHALFGGWPGSTARQEAFDDGDADV
jgi:hypothetical protein